MTAPAFLLRVWRFNAVGAMGFVVQLAALAVLHGWFGLSVWLATALAVELAVLHNFVWHERWTWRDRGGARGVWQRLVRFNLTTGLISLAVNIALMQWLVVWMGAPYLRANLVCVAAGAVANYAAADRFVFAAGPVTPG